MQDVALHVVPMRPRSARKRAAILAGAKEVFLELGYGAASMDVISERAEVSKRTIYKHFSSKYELFCVIVRQLCTGVMPGKGELESIREMPTAAALHALGVQFLSEIYHPQHVALFRTVLGEVRQFPEIGSLIFDGPISKSENRLAAYFEYKMDRGDLNFTSAKRAAAQFLGLLKGDLHLRLLFMKRERVSAREIDEQVRSAVDLFLCGALDSS